MYCSVWCHVEVYGIKQSLDSVLIKNSECLRKIAPPEPIHAGQETAKSVVGLSKNVDATIKFAWGKL